MALLTDSCSCATRSSAQTHHNDLARISNRKYVAKPWVQSDLYVQCRILQKLMKSIQIIFCFVWLGCGLAFFFWLFPCTLTSISFWVKLYAFLYVYGIVCVCVSTKGDTLLPDVSFSRSSFVVVSFHSAVMHIIQYFYSVHGYSIILTFWLCARFLPAR